VGLAETDYAYLAGLIDGEGHIGVYGTRSPIVEIAMTDRGVIEWLKDTFGGSIYTPTVPKANARQYWKWNSSSTAMMTILRLTIPYMKTKRRHAEIFVELMEIRSVRLGNKKNRPEDQEALCQELSQLNHRGVSTH
jgi:hypothetical protein